MNKHVSCDNIDDLAALVLELCSLEKGTLQNVITRIMTLPRTLCFSYINSRNN